MVTQLVTDASASMKSPAAISGVRAAGKGDHHHELTHLAAFGIIGNRLIVAGIPTPQKLVTGDAEQRADAPVEEGASLFWRYEVNARDRINV
jgi:hypothetical protein